MKEIIKNVALRIRKLMYREKRGTYVSHEDWRSKHYNRIAVINVIASKLGFDSVYLEIGCQDNLMFDSVAVRTKVGVDPQRGGTLRMTSDVFFRQNKHSFDLIFIDGLHTIEQVSKDFKNSVSALNPGGFIVIHDLLPRNWIEQASTPLGTEWLGDVWKLSAHISKFSNMFDFYIVNVDHGVGVLRILENSDVPDVDIRTLKQLEFDRFEELKTRLTILDFDEFVKKTSSISM